jgi:hypothetical protein
MNNTLFVWLLFLPLMAFGQQKNVVVDSTWISNKTGVFYQNKYVEYDNGEISTTVTPLGDTLTAFRNFREKFQTATQNMANDAQIVSDYRRQLTEMIRLLKYLDGVIGRNISDSLRSSQANLYAATGWKINNTAFRFRLTNAGVFQWKADSTSTWRPAAYLGNIIRLNSLNGYNTDFTKTPKGRWETINRQYTIRPPGDNAARATEDQEATAVPTPAPQPPTELLPNGTVRIGEIVYRYSTAKKQWVVKK